MSDRLWQRVAIALVVIGLGIATYLTYVHYSNSTAICGLGGQCETVQNSQWAELAGIPVALLGALGYAAMLVALLIPRELGLIAAAAIGLIGAGFSGYLTYREIFTLKAVCPWCVASAIIFTLLAMISVVRLLRADHPRP